MPYRVQICHSPSERENHVNWYYAKNNERLGPIDDAELTRLLSTAEIGRDTLVWKEGMSDWAPLGTLPDIVRVTPSPGVPAAAPAPVSSTAVSAPAMAGVEMATCAVSGRQFPKNQMIQIGNDYVSAEYKNIYLNRVREGVYSGGVPSNFRYAGFWVRFAAMFIDGILAFTVNFGIGLFAGIAFGNRTDGGSTAAMIFLVYILPQVIWTSYYTFFIGKYGATPGKMAVGIKVIRPDGQPISFLRAFGRYWSYWLSYIPIGIGFIMAGFDDEKRALHDRVCDTRVIYK